MNGAPGAPITNDSVVVCSGANTGPIESTATGVSFTLTPGATLGVPPGNRAIALGAGALIDLQVGSIVTGSTNLDLVRAGDNSAIFSSGTVTQSGSGRVLYGGLDTVIAVAGAANGFISVPLAQVLVGNGASVGEVVQTRYVSSAGTVGRVELVPILSNQELYNEPTGRVTGGVRYAGSVASPGGAGTVLVRDNIVVNRGHIGPEVVGGRALAVWSISSIGNIQFTNESGATVDGEVQIKRGYRAGGSIATNHGTINGRLTLEYATDDMPYDPAPGGVDQLVENFGSVREVWVLSGRYIQRASGSFAPGSPLRIEFWRNDDGTYSLGTAQIDGSQTVGCVYGGNQNLRPGGVLELSTGAALTIDSPVGETCDFRGPTVGAGRIVKKGSGTQVVGKAPIPLGWQVPSPGSSYAGGTRIEAGTLAVRENDALGTGAVSFAGAGGRLQAVTPDLVLANPLEITQSASIDTGSHTLTVTGPSTGPGVVRKEGAGTLVWPGARAHTGTTTVDAGTLRLSGVLGGALTVKSGAVLDGHAAVAGPFVLEAGATLRARMPVAGAGVVAAPNVTLGGALDLIEEVVPAIGQAATVVAVGGNALATGTFAGLPQNAVVSLGANTYRVSYAGGDGNDITVTRITPLLAPANLVATAGDASITLSFSPPPPNGEPVSGYRATCSPGAFVADAVGSPIVVTGLTNGTTYACTIAALGPGGAGPPTGEVSATPGALPGVVRNLAVVDGDSMSGIDFDPPASGGPFLDYRAACSPGDRVVETVTPPLVVDQLANGTSYACEVTARNAIGRGTSVQASLRPLGTLLSDGFE